MSGGRAACDQAGGSLLDWPELAVRFQRWLAAQPPAANVLVVGGGPIVEGLRELDRLRALAAGRARIGWRFGRWA